MSLAILCACFQALAEDQSNQSENSTEMVNLIDLAQQTNLDTLAGLNITPVALGKNASVNLVLGLPGSILKMHYHRYHDEITYCIKGQAAMNVSGKELMVKVGDLMYIPALTLHGSEVTGNDTLQLISIFVPPFDGKDRIYV